MAKVPIPIADVTLDTSKPGSAAKEFVMVVAGFVGLGAAGIAAQRVLNAGADAAGSDEELGVL